MRGEGWDDRDHYPQTLDPEPQTLLSLCLLPSYDKLF